MHEQKLSPLQFAEKYEQESYTFEFPESGFVPEKLHQWMTGKRVLDLGCGPVLNIQGLFYQNAELILGMDLSQDNLEFLENLRSKGAITENQKRAVRYRETTLQGEPLGAERRVADLYKRMQLKAGDVTKRDPTLSEQFDNVLQCGCFGCLENAEQFCDAVSHAASYMTSGGKLLMMNWLQSDYVARPFSFNGAFSTLLNEDIYRVAFERSGLSLVVMERSSTLTACSRANGNVAILWAVAEKS